MRDARVTVFSSAEFASLPTHMFHILPIELVIQVFTHAAHFNTRAERSHVVNIALVSRIAYETVAPRTYRAFVVPYPHPFFQQPNAIGGLQNVLRHVQCMYADVSPFQPLSRDHWDLVDALLEAWNPRPGAAFYGPPECYLLLGHENPTKCRNIARLRIRRYFIADYLRDAPEISAGLTHVSVWLPSLDITRFTTPQDWSTQLLEVCPNLTHLRLEQRPAKAAEAPSILVNWVTDIAKAIFAAEPLVRIERILAYFPACIAAHAPDRPLILAVLKEVNDSRFIISLDEREAGHNMDVWSDRDMWERYVGTEHWTVDGQLVET